MATKIFILIHCEICLIDLFHPSHETIMTAKANEDFLKFLNGVNYNNNNDNKDSINPNQLFNNSHEFNYSSLTKNDSTPPLSINDSSSPESSTSNNKLDDKRKAIDELEFDNQPNKRMFYVSCNIE